MTKHFSSGRVFSEVGVHPMNGPAMVIGRATKALRVAETQAEKSAADEASQRQAEAAARAILDAPDFNLDSCNGADLTALLRWCQPNGFSKYVKKQDKLDRLRELEVRPVAAQPSEAPREPQPDAPTVEEFKSLIERARALENAENDSVLLTGTRKCIPCDIVPAEKDARFCYHCGNPLDTVTSVSH